MDNSWNNGASGSYGDHEVNYTPCIDLTEPCYQQTHSQMEIPPGTNLPQDTNAVVDASNQPQNKARDKNYSNAEDEILCSAWLNISKDATVGTSQSSGSYWGRVAKYFNDFRRTSIERSQNSVQKRWADIQKETFKFSCCVAEILRINQSGKTEDDRVKDALQLYQGRFNGKSFKYMHCWLILRHEQKWNEYVASLSAPKPTESPAQGSPSIGAQPSEPTSDRRTYERPMGRDRAKKQRSSSTSSNSSACYEMLKKMQLDRANFEEQLRASNKDESEEISSRSDRKLALQEQQVQLAARSTMVQEQMFKLQEKEREDRLMAMEIDNMKPWQRQYFIDQQVIVAAKASQEAAKAKAEAERLAGEAGTDP